MLRRFTALLCALVMCLSALPVAQAAKAKTLTVSFQVTTYQNRARTLLKQINQLRKDSGAGELVMLADLEKVAIQRASELFVFFDHDIRTFPATIPPLPSTRAFPAARQWPNAWRQATPRRKMCLPSGRIQRWTAFWTRTSPTPVWPASI